MLDIGPHSTMIQIVIGIRSAEYLAATGLYSVGVRITADMQSAQYSAVNSIDIADTGPSACRNCRAPVARRIGKVTEPEAFIVLILPIVASVCRPIVTDSSEFAECVKKCFIKYAWIIIILVYSSKYPIDIHCLGLSLLARIICIAMKNKECTYDSI